MHTSLLSAAFFQKNRAELLKKSRLPVIVIPANGVIQRNGDTTFPFVQDSNFWYLTGSAIPDATLVVTESEEWLIVPTRSDIRTIFDGAIDANAIRDRSNISEVLDEPAGWKRLKSLLKGRQPVVGVPLPAPAYDNDHGMYSNPSRSECTAKLKELVPQLTLEDIRPVLAGMRMIKQPEELLCIENAAKITKKAIGTVTTAAKLTHYHYEYEIEAALEYEFRRQGGSGHAFTPIVAAGSHATTLHYIQNDGVVTAGNYIILDVGTEFEHYASDISRTVCVGSPNSRQQTIYDAVADVQQRALALIKPGVPYREYERQVTTYVGEALLSLGLIKRQDDIAAIRRYYPHASSHFLGLDVHDVGDYRTSFLPNMVITCEPGIYVPEEGIGVRIEDDVVVTQSGHRVL